MTTKRTPTPAELQALFDYNEETGDLIWKSHPSPRHQNLVGLRAGCINDRGSWVVRVLGRTYKVHRIAWVLMTGHWPTHDVEHQGDKSDNAFVNLCDLTL